MFGMVLNTSLFSQVFYTPVYAGRKLNMYIKRSEDVQDVQKIVVQVLVEVFLQILKCPSCMLLKIIMRAFSHLAL